MPVVVPLVVVVGVLVEEEPVAPAGIVGKPVVVPGELVERDEEQAFAIAMVRGVGSALACDVPGDDPRCIPCNPLQWLVPSIQHSQWAWALTL